MSSVLEFVPSLSRTGLLQQGSVLEAIEGSNVTVQLEETRRAVDCQVLQTGTPALTLSEGDAVLVWVPDGDARTGVVLGRIGSYTPRAEPVVAPAEFAARPQTLVLEAQGDVVLRNGQAKITLGADGDVEIVCSSFSTRSQRILRLLAPLIKLN